VFSANAVSVVAVQENVSSLMPPNTKWFANSVAKYILFKLFVFLWSKRADNALYAGVNRNVLVQESLKRTLSYKPKAVARAGSSMVNHLRFSAYRRSNLSPRTARVGCDEA